MLTWESRQDDCVWAGSLRVSGGVLGLEDLVEVEKLPVPPVDQVLAPSFNPHLYNKPLEEEKKKTRVRMRSRFVLDMRETRLG